jgi:hypothetical protein
MKLWRVLVCAAGLAAPAWMMGQSLVESASVGGSETGSAAGAVSRRAAQPVMYDRPLTRWAWSEGVSPLGVNVSAVTNLGSQANLRVAGNALIYNVNNIQTNGITLGATARFASVQVALDVYPWARHGFHVSPGLLPYNGNHISASANIPAGESLSLNDATYYSAFTNPATGAVPLAGNGKVVLNRYNPTPTLTAGWGNLLGRKGHFTVPVEVGAAFIGHPTIGLNLSGWACIDQAQTMCANLGDATNPIAVQVQQNLSQQMESWKEKMKLLSTYPIISIGVGYSFGPLHGATAR